MAKLKEILMERDDISEAEAEDIIHEMRERVFDGEDPEEILYENGLEPDYIFELIY